MKKFLSFIALSLFLNSCTAEPITAQDEPQTAKQTEDQTPKEIINTFTVAWESNQESPYVVFKTYVLRDCELIKTSEEVHQEKSFDIKLEIGQIFEIDIRREHSVKNPELYLNITKGGALQYEQEVNTNGFLLQTYIDGNGNISEP